jgi:hypothetical protein
MSGKKTGLVEAHYPVGHMKSEIFIRIQHFLEYGEKE